MTEAFIVSTARTGLGKSWKGAFNMTYGATLGAHSVRHAVERAGIGSLHEGQKLSFELERDQRSGKMSAGQLQTV